MGGPAAPSGPRDHGGSPAPSGPPRIAWDETGCHQGLAAVGRVPPRRRGLRIAAAVGLVVLLGVAGGVAVRALGATAATTPDPLAVDQVAQRYRALGADLLLGARSCAALPPPPARPSAWPATSRPVPAPSRSSSSRSTPGRGCARSGPRSRPSRQTRCGRVAAAGQRGVAAERPLIELLAFFDARRPTAVERPELPGAAFASPTMWRLPRAVVRQESDAECAAVPPSAGYPGAVEQDTCRFPDGMVADFGAVADVAAFNRLRVALSSPPGIVPGTQWTGAWDGDEIRPGRWGVLHGEGFSTERLQRFWLTE